MLQSKDSQSQSEFLRFAFQELGNARLGDKRRTPRVCLITFGLIANLGAAISNSCGKNGSQLVSRFFKRKEVTVDSILESHIEKTAQRCGKYDLVYAVQDSTSLNYGTHKALKGVGPLSSSSRDQGLMMHSVLAVSPEGTPQGLLDVNLWARDSETFGDSKIARSLPVEEKESFKWIRGLARTEKALPPQQRVWLIGDRECDFYPIFAWERRPNTELLVRNCYNRRILDEEAHKIQDALAKAPVLDIYEVEIKRQGKRKKRTAKLAVKSTTVRLKRPSHLSGKKYPDFVEVQCVNACEIDAPADVKEPLEWTLLSTVKAPNFKKACRLIKAYSHRWIIEDYHKILKSGCKVEGLQFEATDSLLPAIALLGVVAYKVLYLSRLGREFPDLPASEVSNDEERMVLEAWISANAGRKFRNFQIKTVQDFILCVAIAGGFKARKCDGFPGAKTTWLGLRKLNDLVEGFRLAARLRSSK